MEKLKTLLWFAQRPSFYPHMLALTGRKLRGAAALEANYAASLAWAAKLAIDREAALREVDLPDVGEPGVPARLLDEADDRVRRSGVAMGGAGDLDLSGFEASGGIAWNF